MPTAKHATKPQPTLPASIEVFRAGRHIDDAGVVHSFAEADLDGMASSYNPALREMVARGRWEDAKRTGAKVMVAACPQSTEALRGTAPDGYAYKDLFVLLNERA